MSQRDFPVVPCVCVAERCSRKVGADGDGRAGRAPPLNYPRLAPAKACVRLNGSRGDTLVGGAHDVGAPAVRIVSQHDVLLMF